MGTLEALSCWNMGEYVREDPRAQTQKTYHNQQHAIWI